MHKAIHGLILSATGYFLISIVPLFSIDKADCQQALKDERKQNPPAE